MTSDPVYQDGNGLKYGVSKEEAEIKREKLLQIIRDLARHKNANNENGVPEVGCVLDCTGQRAVALGFGQLTDGKTHVFNLPLPPSLKSRAEWRRLTITLAWLSPVSTKTQKYRTAALWFDMKANNLGLIRRDANWQAGRRKTVQHEVFEGKKAEAFVNRDTIEIKVNCREDAGKIQNPVAYGLAVSLEVAEGTNIDIYNEVRERITQPTAIQILGE